jgi:hypothetical protein
MYLDIPLIANVLTLADLRQKQIDKRLMRANAKRKTHDYQVSDQVLIKRELDASSKLEPTYKRPYPIVQVHTNGTVTVLLQPNTTERKTIAHSAIASLGKGECIPLMMSLLNDVSRMPCDRDMVIGHKGSSFESACNLIIVILFLCVIHCAVQQHKLHCTRHRKMED